MPDFNKLFDVVLHQGAGPLAYFSRPFAAHHLKLATYERELIGLVQAVRHWRPYLRGRAFLVRTDHYSLKFLLDQRLLTVPQHQWISKLFGYDFEVEYRPGRLNVAVDALSAAITRTMMRPGPQAQYWPYSGYRSPSWRTCAGPRQPQPTLSSC